MNRAERIMAGSLTRILPFDEWTSVIASERLTGALLEIATGEVAKDALEAGKEYARRAASLAGPQSARKSVTVGEWKEITRAVSQDGQQRMIVKLTPNDLHRFVEETFRTEDAPVALMPPRSYWAPSQMSGLYESAEDAERAAYMELRWLRISN